MGKSYWKGVVLPSALYGAEVIYMKGEEIDILQKSENNALRRILRPSKCAAQAAIRGEIGISNMKSKKNSKEKASIPKNDRNRK